MLFPIAVGLVAIISLSKHVVAASSCTPLKVDGLAITNMNNFRTDPDGCTFNPTDASGLIYHYFCVTPQTSGYGSVQYSVTGPVGSSLTLQLQVASSCNANIFQTLNYTVSNLNGSMQNITVPLSSLGSQSITRIAWTGFTSNQQWVMSGIYLTCGALGPSSNAPPVSTPASLSSPPSSSAKVSSSSSAKSSSTLKTVAPSTSSSSSSVQATSTAKIVASSSSSSRVTSSSVPPSSTIKSSSSSSTLSSSTTKSTSSSSTSSAQPTSTNSSKLRWFGINESGAEFGQNNIPGTYNQDYTWYDFNTIDQLLAQGMNMFRVNFLMERLTPSLTGSFDSDYLGHLTSTINYITSKGAYAMVQPHNYGRFYQNVITDVNGFQTWWKNVATLFKENPLAVFDVNNEFHDMDQTLVFNLNQAAINGIRSAGATSQYITPEGNAYTGAWTWVSSGNGASLVNLVDPSNKLVFQMHQYLDGDGSGTSDSCVSSTALRDRLQSATQWLKDNNKVGIIGEYAGGNNAQCIAALKDGLAYMQQNNDVWLGAIWWAAGPWWGNYIFSMEPTNGVAWVNILPQIKSYFI